MRRACLLSLLLLAACGSTAEEPAPSEPSPAAAPEAQAFDRYELLKEELEALFQGPVGEHLERLQGVVAEAETGHFGLRSSVPGPALHT